MAGLDPIAVAHSASVVAKAIQALESAGTAAPQLQAIANISKSYLHDGFGVTVDKYGRCDSATIFLSGASIAAPLMAMQRKLANDYNGADAFALCRALIAGIDTLAFDSQFGLALRPDGQCRFKGMLTCPEAPAGDLVQALRELDLFSGELAETIHPPSSQLIEGATIDTIGVNATEGVPELKVYLEKEYAADDLRGLLDQYPLYWSDNNLDHFIEAVTPLGYRANLVVAPLFGDASRRVYFMCDQPPRSSDIMEAMDRFFGVEASALADRLEAAGCKPYVLRISDDGKEISCRVYMEQLNSDQY